MQKLVGPFVHGRMFGVLRSELMSIILKHKGLPTGLLL